MRVSLSSDPEFALSCLRLHQRMRTFAESLLESLPDVDVLWLVLRHSALQRQVSDFGFRVVIVGVSMNFGRAPASIGSS